LIIIHSSTKKKDFIYLVNFEDIAVLERLYMWDYDGFVGVGTGWDYHIIVWDVVDLSYHLWMYPGYHSVSNILGVLI